MVRVVGANQSKADLYLRFVVGRRREREALGRSVRVEARRFERRPASTIVDRVADRERHWCTRRCVDVAVVLKGDVVVAHRAKRSRG